MKSFIKRFSNDISRKYVVNRYLQAEKEYFKKIRKRNPHLFTSEEGENEWLEKWSKYGLKINKNSYRVFSKFIGHNVDIVPLEVFSSIIEPVLTPLNFYAVYNEKNMFSKLFNSQGIEMPKVLLRCIEGRIFDENYNCFTISSFEDVVKDYKSIVIKPSFDSNSGKGVLVISDISKYKGKFEKLFSEYGLNYVVQVCIEQSDYMKMFNKDSVNTIRLIGYRSVKDNELYFTNAVLRIGRKGSSVDNTGMGGMYCSVNEEGELGKFVVDYYGSKLSVFNDIDFSSEKFTIPNYQKVLDLAKLVGDSIYHSRLIAYDIAINKEGNPILIEVNVGKFSAYLFQFTHMNVFGEFSNEVIEHCYNEIEKYPMRNYLV